MNSNADEQQRPELPAYIELPVEAGCTCSQETVDRLLSLLWDAAPDLVTDMAEEEQWPFPECRGTAFRDACYAIEEFIIDGTKEAPLSGLEILDIMSELSRRIRQSMGLKAMPVFGNALAESPEGPLPALIAKPVSHEHDWRSEENMTQEMADKVCALAYEKDPALMYQVAEEKRRMISSYTVNEALKNLMEEIKKAENVTGTFGFRTELKARLSDMCALPSFEEMREALA